MSDLAIDVVKLVNGWLMRCGFSLKHASRLTALDAAIGGRNTTTEERVLRAAACDLLNTLRATSQGRQALRDLGFDPVSQNSEGE